MQLDSDTILMIFAGLRVNDRENGRILFIRCSIRSNLKEDTSIVVCLITYILSIITHINR